MNGLAKVKINGFNFDSDSPVQGNVLDEEKEKTKVAFIHSAMHNLIAINVILLGWWLMDWWVTGGVTWMYYAFHRWAPTLMRMITTGQV